MESDVDLGKALKDAWDRGEFERKVQAEKEILKNHPYETLLSMASAMSVYINHAMPILMRDTPLMTQAYINGIKEAKKIRSADSRKGGVNRAKKDERTIALNCIKTEDYPATQHRFHLRGRRNNFANEMLIKYPILVSKESILRLVDKLNKKNGITQKKPIATQPAQ